MNINATLIGQLLTFAILVWFTMRYVWPPIIKAMHEREEKITSGLIAAENAQRELLLAKEQAREILTIARKEAQQIIEKAQKNSAKLLDEARLKSKKEQLLILARTKEEIKREINCNKQELQDSLARLAIAGAEKIIGKNLDHDSQTKLIDDIISGV
jgi:F-type H+-transporting ATPase subunit b